MILLSVIVPVYQCKSYLSCCVGSILAQPVEEMELILVDDGSTDGSDRLCDQLAKMDERIRVLHQNNGGVSAARNVGLAAARGKYVQFVDGDDWLEEGYSRALLNAAEERDAELVIAGYQNIYGHRRTSQMPPAGDFSYPKALAEDFDRFYFSMLLNSPCNKLYCRDLIKAGFPLGVPMGEDLMFNMSFLEGVNRMATTQTDGYLYIHRGGSSSASTRFSQHSVSAMLDYCSCVRPFLEKWLARQKAERSYDRIVFHSLCNNLNMLARQDMTSKERLDSYMTDPRIKETIRRVELDGFPKAKKAVGLCLKLHLPAVAMLGIRVAARQT